MGSFFPASSSRTLAPWEVSTWQAMPPAAPEPITTASYVFVRSTTESAIAGAFLYRAYGNQRISEALDKQSIARIVDDLNRLTSASAFNNGSGGFVQWNVGHDRNLTQV